MAGIIRAVLGPTNTGKTHYAVERMLSYASGMMGFPLRLLAREVYDKVVAVKGKNQVALLTGEERIVPAGARYFLCTAEAMPHHKTVDFIAIDEVQMAADTQRGHIFTEHLLHSRGVHETLFLGASTMGPVLRQIVPDLEIMGRERFSDLRHIRPVKLSKLPRRSAVVGFSAGDVYAMAELVRRQKGGAAIVMGALSPRTRNAQVEMYQSGEVDHLIATDAIGMGLNLDVTHVAFAGLSKFDGQTYRGLSAAEAAQIAGRAGRYQTDGTFSTLGGGEGEAMSTQMISQIEEHRFEPVKTLFWRNHRLDFTSIGTLQRSLSTPAQQKSLHRIRDSLDELILAAFATDPQTLRVTNTRESVIKLWDVCQIPDFRKLSLEDHTSLLKRIYQDLMGPSGTISHDFVARQVKQLDIIDGDIDTLAGRIASIRVWTYVSHRKGWLSDGAHWAHVTRSVEDRLSDALHEKLTQRFVDRRTAVLMRSLRQRDALSVSIDSDTNQVSVEGHEIGQLNGFSFRVDASGAPAEQKTLQAAAEAALQIELARRAKLFANVGYKTLQLSFTEGLAFPKLVWDGAVIATLHDSGALFAPRVKQVSSSLLTGDLADLVSSKMQEWLDTRIAEKLEPLIKLAQELNGESEPPEGTPPLSGLVRGVAFRLLEHYGVMPRSLVSADLKQLDQDARKSLRRFGIRIGASSVYMPLVMKPHATELRLAMWAMAGQKTALPAIPTPGMVWVETEATAPREFYELAGFQVTGKKAVRMDMLERLSDAVRPLGQAGGWFEVTPEIMGLVGLSGQDFAEVMQTAGYRHEIRQVSPTPVPAPATTEPTSPAASADTGVAEAPEAPEAEPTTKQNPVEQPVSAQTEEKPSAEPTETTPEPAAEPATLVERYYFSWTPKKRPQQKEARSGRGKSAADGTKKKPAHHNTNRPSGGKPRPQQQVRPPRKEKPIDPDSPFAALAGLKDALTKKK